MSEERSWVGWDKMGVGLSVSEAGLLILLFCREAKFSPTTLPIRTVKPDLLIAVLSNIIPIAFATLKKLIEVTQQRTDSRPDMNSVTSHFLIAEVTNIRTFQLTCAFLMNISSVQI